MSNMITPPSLVNPPNFIGDAVNTDAITVTVFGETVTASVAYAGYQATDTSWAAYGGLGPTLSIAGTGGTPASVATGANQPAHIGRQGQTGEYYIHSGVDSRLDIGTDDMYFEMIHRYAADNRLIADIKGSGSADAGFLVFNNNYLSQIIDDGATALNNFGSPISAGNLYVTSGLRDKSAASRVYTNNVSGSQANPSAQIAATTNNALSLLASAAGSPSGSTLYWFAVWKLPNWLTVNGSAESAFVTSRYNFWTA